MVSDRDRAHFRAIAEGMEEENRRAIERDAKRPPGDKIREAFALSRWPGIRTTDPEPPPPSMVLLWRQRHQSFPDALSDFPSRS